MPILFLLFALFALNAQAFDEEKFEQGFHYEIIEKPLPKLTQQDSEVIEFFYYGCPHCFRFEPHLLKWLQTKPENVAFIAMPAVFSKEWMVLAKAYYTAHLLDILGQSHHALFMAIHGEHKRFKNEKALAKFSTQFGVTEEQYLKMYNSFGVDSLTRRAAIFTGLSGITGVPALVVNGKYRVLGKTYQEMLEITDFLIEKDLKAEVVEQEIKEKEKVKLEVKQAAEEIEQRNQSYIEESSEKASEFVEDSRKESENFDEASEGSNP